MKTIYIIANLNVNTCGESPWMNTMPFIKNDCSPGTGLQLISDIHWNCIGEKDKIIYFTLYKIEVNNYNEFLRKRSELFDSKDFSKTNIESFGFVNMNNFEYKVDENDKKQMINGYEVTLSYHKVGKFPDKFYLDCPSIYFD
jgi:hypothetical protein